MANEELTLYGARLPTGENAAEAEEIRFKWHFPRGTLQARMSALELAEFLLPHMPHIVPLLASHPRVQAEFEAMLKLLVLTPKDKLDVICGWVQSVCQTADFDYIVMSFTAAPPKESTRKYFYKRYVRS